MTTAHPHTIVSRDDPRTKDDPKMFDPTPHLYQAARLMSRTMPQTTIMSRMSPSPSRIAGGNNDNTGTPLWHTKTTLVACTATTVFKAVTVSTHMAVAAQTHIVHTITTSREPISTMVVMKTFTMLVAHPTDQPVPRAVMDVTHLVALHPQKM
jgi:hypothetical protein